MTRLLCRKVVRVLSEISKTQRGASFTQLLSDLLRRMGAETPPELEPITDAMWLNAGQEWLEHVRLHTPPDPKKHPSPEDILRRQQRLRKLARYKVYSTGHVAEICQVSAGTVRKWFDSGRLPGYTMCDTKERRVPTECLVQFCEEYNISPEYLSAVSSDQHLCDELR